MQKTSFEFSDLIAGYVTDYDSVNEVFDLETSDGRTFKVKLTSTTFAELMRNLGEPFIDCTGQMKDFLMPGRYLFAYGIHFPESDKPFEVKHIVFPGRSETEYRFEKQDWWIKQIRELGDFYLNAQFGDGEIDYSKYRTMLTLYGAQTNDDYRQEGDTISRLVFGFASAYMITGNERYLEAAEKGTDYLRDHFRALDTTEDYCYWYHGIEIKGNRERKILSSEFGDDFDAIPAYEQIYALAGPVQTYRATGDPAILEDARRTLNLFERFFLDREQGGYFSHIDPITFDPRSVSLGNNRARKNWNSVGDHAPAFLINLFLATGEKDHGDMLAYCADMIEGHFPDFEKSAFVQEKFHEDWSHDEEWGWQQNRGVVGHNLKIAWNLMRIYHMKPEERYKTLAEKIAALMPEHGMDKQRGGWYDVVDRVLQEGETVHRFAWHDRKAWWQQEQGILAYLILAGSISNPDYLKYARESTAFYNSWFLDHDSGGVYFNVLAEGMPYLVGTERFKGSHSMSGYHSFELCYLAAIYTNLLVAKHPMDFYFKPKPSGFKDNKLRVAPDLLPAGSIIIESVTINGEAHSDFDAKGLVVNLPPSDERVTVKVRIAPTSGVEHFEVDSSAIGETVTIRLRGELDALALPHFRNELQKGVSAQELVIDMSRLTYLSPEAGRALVFYKQKMGLDSVMTISGASEEIRSSLDEIEFTEEATMID